jgi:serine/threonine protein kinase
MEAQITGQLEHPNIIPIHELNRLEDGSLFYTMKLLRGETLARYIKKYIHRRTTTKQDYCNCTNC